jgi:hypothetical protein
MKAKKMEPLTILASFFAGVLLCGAIPVAYPDERHHTGERIFPGEYESHQAVWMLRPTYENKGGFPSTEPISDMIYGDGFQPTFTYRH